MIVAIFLGTATVVLAVLMGGHPIPSTLLGMGMGAALTAIRPRTIPRPRGR
jgi:hypothetical protein